MEKNITWVENDCLLQMQVTSPDCIALLRVTGLCEWFAPGGSGSHTTSLSTLSSMQLVQGPEL